MFLNILFEMPKTAKGQEQPDTGLARKRLCLKVPRWLRALRTESFCQKINSVRNSPHLNTLSKKGIFYDTPADNHKSRNEKVSPEQKKSPRLTLCLLSVSVLLLPRMSPEIGDTDFGGAW